MSLVQRLIVIDHRMPLVRGVGISGDIPDRLMQCRLIGLGGQHTLGPVAENRLGNARLSQPPHVNRHGGSGSC